MKRIVLMMLCMVCFTAPIALAEEIVTLAELKRQAPQTLTLDVIDKDGNAMHIDMPVVLPEGETLPVLRVKPMLFDTADMLMYFPLEKELPSYTKGAMLSVFYDGVPSLYITAVPKNGDKPRASGAFDTESGRYIMPNEKPESNDMPADRPLEIVKENVKRFTGRGDFDIRVYKQYPMSGLYRYKNVAKWDSPLDLSTPRKGYEKGTWVVYTAQYLQGAEVFQHMYRPTAKHTYDKEDAHWPDQAGGYMFALEEDDFILGLSLVDETEVVLDDAPLAPFSAIEAAIEERIASGQLKSGYKLTLGYQIFCRPGEPSYLPEDGDPAAARFTLVPAWRIDGYDLKDEKQVQGREITSEPIEFFDHYSYSLRLDALTGDVLLDYHTDL